MKAEFTPLPRAEVVGYLGPNWPPPPGSTVLRLLSIADATDGALTIHATDGRPGTTWWVVDGLIVPQDAGPPVLLPGDRLETTPEPAADTPPLALDTP